MVQTSFAFKHFTAHILKFLPTSNTPLHLYHIICSWCYYFPSYAMTFYTIYVFQCRNVRATDRPKLKWGKDVFFPLPNSGHGRLAVRLLQIDRSTANQQYKHSFYPRIIRNWNLLPSKLKDSPSLDSFKNGLPVHYY